MACLWIHVGLYGVSTAWIPISPHIRTGNKPSTYRDPYRRWSSDGWIRNCCMDPWSMEWMIEHFGLKIRTHDMHYTTIDSQKVNDSNQRPCTTPPLTPKMSRFKPTTMHNTTIDDPRKDKYSNPRHALHHHWLPQSQRFEPSMEKPSNHKNTWLHRAISTETLENKNSNAPSKFLIIWLTDKATIPIGRSKWWKQTQN
jgi:hypothetical protein